MQSSEVEIDSKLQPEAPKQEDVYEIDSDREDDTASQIQPHNDHGDRKQSITSRRKIKKKRVVSVNLSGTKYEIVRQVTIEKFGMQRSKDDDVNSFLYWCDTALPAERIAEFKPYQRVNHFPGMGEICRKDSLARNLQKMLKELPDSYGFFPRTWILPAEYNVYQSYCRDLKKHKKTKTFICKPSNGAMGMGISLTRNFENVPANENYVVQEYLDKPLLIDGLKFDIRIYVLLTSCDPLRIFLFDDGLVRLSTQPYTPPSEHNLERLFMHLTNYSINKHNEDFVDADEHDKGSKRSIKYLNSWLKSRGHNVQQIWNDIADVIIKTIIVAEPHLLHIYRTCRPNCQGISNSVCFEILGFDILLDRKLRPWLLEVNRSPSFGTDGRIDYDIKSNLIADTVRLLNIKLSDRRKGMAAQKAEVRKRLLRPVKRSIKEKTDKEIKQELIGKRIETLRERLSRIRVQSAREDYENSNLGGFRRIFPSEDSRANEKYNSLIDTAFKVVLAGSSSLHKDGPTTLENLQEEEILDMLEQCEIEIDSDKKQTLRTQKSLVSMPSSTQGAEANVSKSISADSNLLVNKSDKPKIVRTEKKPKSSNRPYLSKTCAIDDDYIRAAIRQREEELTNRTLAAFTEMKIRFPGKSDDEAKFILHSLQENWKFHKPRVASYWLVKLDSIKRKKVIDIVKTNVSSVLQYIWRTSDVENLRLSRIFNRVFNRLLWSHGQGLWNCFSSIGNSWEVIFNKSTEAISPIEMSCCRRIVQLCRDCLLIVYQFACEAKLTDHSTVQNTTTRSTVGYNTWKPSQSISARFVQH